MWVGGNWEFRWSGWLAGCKQKIILKDVKVKCCDIESSLDSVVLN